jgi:predicted PurR-regulated permease PerM
MNWDEWPRSARVALGLLTVAAVVWLLNRMLALIAYFWDIILLFFLAWLLSFTLHPIVDQLSNRPVPGWFLALLRRTGQEATARRLAAWHMPRGIATALVYLALVVVFIAGLVFIIPVGVTQLGQLAGRLPAYGAEILDWFERLQRENPPWLERLDAQAAQFGVNLEEAYQSIDIIGWAQGLGTRLAQNTLGLAATLGGFLAEAFLILILSFYITLDTPRLARWIINVVPPDLQDECVFLFRSVNQTFGGFIRSQLIMAVLSTLGTMLIMQLAGLGFVIVVSLFSGLIMLIPVIGAPIALFLPTLIGLFQQGLATAIYVFFAIFALQQLVLHILMPRIMSQTMGMHPLLVFAALLIGVRVAGFWGALFGIPVVGVLVAMLGYAYRRTVLGDLPLEPEDSPVPTPRSASGAPAVGLEESPTQEPS